MRQLPPVRRRCLCRHPTLPLLPDLNVASVGRIFAPLFAACTNAAGRVRSRFGRLREAALKLDYVSKAEFDAWGRPEAMIGPSVEEEGAVCISFSRGRAGDRGWLSRSSPGTGAL